MNPWTQTLRAVRDVVRHARSSSELFKLIRPGEGEVLNAVRDGEVHEPRTSAQVLDALTGLRHELETMAYITQEARVDYTRLADSETLQRLREAARGLHDVTLESLREDVERKAFFINLYNVLMIHAVVVLEIERSVMEVPTIFSAVGYQVGDRVWTLDAIEHGALRGNAPHPTTRRKVFSQDDPRLDWGVPLDARVHAALVCAAQSCPAIRMYEANALDKQLDMASEAFVQGSTRVDHEREQIETSSIFAWYASDFDASGGVMEFLVRHSRGAHHEALCKARESGYELVHEAYDWTLNGA